MYVCLVFRHASEREHGNTTPGPSGTRLHTCVLQHRPLLVKRPCRRTVTGSLQPALVFISPLSRKQPTIILTRWFEHSSLFLQDDQGTMCTKRGGASCEGEEKSCIPFAPLASQKVTHALRREKCDFFLLPLLENIHTAVAAMKILLCEACRSPFIQFGEGTVYLEVRGDDWQETDGRKKKPRCAFLREVHNYAAHHMDAGRVHRSK